MGIEYHEVIKTRALGNAEAKTEAWCLQSWWGSTVQENDIIKMKKVKYEVHKGWGMNTGDIYFSKGIVGVYMPI